MTSQPAGHAGATPQQNGFMLKRGMLNQLLNPRDLGQVGNPEQTPISRPSFSSCFFRISSINFALCSERKERVTTLSAHGVCLLNHVGLPIVCR